MPPLQQMIAFNNLSGIVALSVMLAGTLGAAAPTPSSAENAPISPFPFQGLGDAVGGLSPAALGSWIGGFQGFKREDADLPMMFTGMSNSKKSEW